MLTVKNNVYIIVIYVVNTVNYCKCILLYSPLNSYIGYWTFNNNNYYSLSIYLNDLLTMPRILFTFLTALAT